MSRLVRPSDAQLQAIHRQLSNFVTIHLRTPDNPAAMIAPYSECKPHSYATHLECRVSGVTKIKLGIDVYRALEKCVHGATIAMEANKDNVMTHAMLTVPIVSLRPERGGVRRTERSEAAPYTPTFRWALMLAVLDVALMGVFYYRL